MADQDLRSFVAAYEQAHPGEVIRIAEPVSIEEDVMALVLEYERRRRYPILLFEQVAGHDIPIVCNVVASRRALAFSLGVDERGLAAEYARRIKDYVKPVVLPDPPFRHRTASGPTTCSSSWRESSSRSASSAGSGAGSSAPAGQSSAAS